MNPSTIGAEAAPEILPLAAIILHDYDESGRRAKALLEQIAANAGEGIQFRLAQWRIDRLTQFETSIGVFRDLRLAAILVLALPMEGGLPKSVFHWVDYWAHCRSGENSALVVLGSPGPADKEELESLAERFGLKLFCEQRNERSSGWWDSLDDLPKPEQTPFPMWEEPPANCWSGYYRHWGLNE